MANEDFADAAQQGRILTCYILADSTGNTASGVLKAARFQFDDRVDVKVLPDIRNLTALKEALSQIEASGLNLGPILTSFVVEDRVAMEMLVADFARKYGIDSIPILNPAVSALERALGKSAKGIPGFMDAIEFQKAHDDGAGQLNTLKEAKIIFIGVSRTGKTSMCAYIASHYGLRVANYPYVNGIEIPDKYREAEEAGAVVIALKKDPLRLRDIRLTRTGTTMFGAASDPYTNLENIHEEQDALIKIARRNGWRILDVTNSLPEETAKQAISILNRTRQKRGQDPYPFPGVQ